MKNFILIAAQLLLITTAYGSEQAENKEKHAAKISLSGIGVPGYQEIVLTNSPHNIASQIDRLEIVPKVLTVLIAEYAFQSTGTMFPSTLHRDENRLTVLTIENSLPCSWIVNLHSTDSLYQHDRHPPVDLEHIKAELARLRPETASNKFIQLQRKRLGEAPPRLSDLSMSTLSTIETLSGPSTLLVAHPPESPEISSTERTSDIYLHGVTRHEIIRAISNFARILQSHLEKHGATSFRGLVGDTLEARKMDDIAEFSNEEAIETILSNPHLAPLVKRKYAPDPYALAD